MGRRARLRPRLRRLAVPPRRHGHRHRRPRRLAGHAPPARATTRIDLRHRARPPVGGGVGRLSVDLRGDLPDTRDLGLRLGRPWARARAVPAHRRAGGIRRWLVPACRDRHRLRRLHRRHVRLPRPCPGRSAGARRRAVRLRRRARTRQPPRRPDARPDRRRRPHCGGPARPLRPTPAHVAGAAAAPLVGDAAGRRRHRPVGGTPCLDHRPAPAWRIGRPSVRHPPRRGRCHRGAQPARRHPHPAGQPRRHEAVRRAGERPRLLAGERLTGVRRHAVGPPRPGVGERRRPAVGTGAGRRGEQPGVHDRRPAREADPRRRRAGTGEPVRRGALERRDLDAPPCRPRARSRRPLHDHLGDTELYA